MEAPAAAELSQSTPPGNRPLLPLVATLAGLAWAWRLLLLGGRAQGQLSWLDPRGFLVDLWIALLLSALVRGRPRFACALALGWTTLNFAIFQHVDVLGVLPNPHHGAFLGDATFVSSSLDGLRFLPLFALALGAGAYAAYRAAAAARAAPQRPLLLALGVLGLLLLWAPVQPQLAAWRQTHALATLPDLFRSAPELTLSDDPALLARVEAAFSPDLSGAPRTRPATTRSKPRNVLLLVFERLCAGYTRRGQQAQGLDYRVQVEQLERLAGEHLFFPNYFSHQAQSNRGLYALLAGDFPHLRTATAKMTEVTTGARERAAFLPRTLRAAGYRTLFLEATPLHFMGMGQFMRQIGFQEVEDGSAIPAPHARGGWGVDDASLLEWSGERIAELERSEQPWFMTVFSAGTHHPYLIPDADFHADEDDFARSFHYLDRAIGALLERLEREGVLKDTLVLVTCDESAGLSSALEEQTERLDKNWGFLLAITPEGWRGDEPMPCGQADLALSVLDYLGLEEEARAFSGRSVFRRYAEPRDLFLANTYTRQVAVFAREGTLVVCDEQLTLSASRAFDPQALLRLGEARPAPPQALAALRGVVARSSGSSGPSAVYDLAGKESRLRAQGSEVLVSGQFFEVPADSVIEVDLDLSFDPGLGGSASLWTEFNDLAGVRHLHQTESGPFRRGGRRRLRFSFWTSEVRHKVELRLGLRRGRGETLIEVAHATLRVTPKSAWVGGLGPPDEVRVEQDEALLAPPGE